jgi:N-acetylglutamate synthase-like GNAT family acetyltransferase
MEYVRKATYEDIERIQFIAQECWDRTSVDIAARKKITLMLRDFYSHARLNNEITNNASSFLLAIDGELAVAFVTYRFNYSDDVSTELNALYCLPQTQGKRFDELLVNEVIKDTIIAGGSKIFVVLTNYIGPVGLFKKIGFELVNEIDSAKQELEILVMSKNL